MWNNYDWDYNFLIKVMVDKMKDMRYQFDNVDKWFVDLRHQPIGTSSPDDSDYESEDHLVGLDRAIELGEKILKGDAYYEYPEDVQKYLDGKRKNEQGSEEMRKKFLECCEKQDEEYRNDIKMFFNIIRDEHSQWWS